MIFRIGIGIGASPAFGKRPSPTWTILGCPIWGFAYRLHGKMASSEPLNSHRCGKHHLSIIFQGKPLIFHIFVPTCQVRVVRFYVNSRASFSASSASSPDLNYDDHSRVFAAGPQPRPSTPSVRCRTSTTTSHAQCSLPDLNHDQPRPVFAAGPQPRPATPSVRCRTSTTTTHAQRSLPDLNHDHPRPVFAAGPQPRPATPSVRCRTSTTTINAQCSLPDLNSYAKSYAG